MNLLIAVDGSDHSYEAVRALKYLSCADKLHILHVLDVPIPAYPMMMPEVSQELYKTVERNMREDGARLLERIVSLLPMATGPVTKHLVAGSPAENIVTLAEQYNVDLILLGTRGLGPIKERLLGSVAHRVLTYASGAKLILPGPLKALSQVLLPLQGTYDADRTMPCAFLNRNRFVNYLGSRSLPFYRIPGRLGRSMPLRPSKWRSTHFARRKTFSTISPPNLTRWVIQRE